MTPVILWILLALVGVYGQDPDATHIIYTSKYELLFYKSEQSYWQAKPVCQSEQAWLLEIDDQYITDTIAPYIQDTYWIGATDEDTEGTWVWADGTRANGVSAPYQNWYGSEPNGGRTQNCLVTGFFHNGKNLQSWEDVECSASYYFICQGGALRVYTSKYELALYNNKKNYASAKKECESKGARFAKIDDQEMTDAISPHIKHTYLIGATDDAHEGVWLWADGAAVNYTNWYSTTEPDGGRTENCVVIGRFHKKWADVTCSSSRYFICQRDLPIHVVTGIRELSFHGSFSGKENKDYSSAKTACENLGAQLVEVVSQAIDQAILPEVIIGEGAFWTGGNYVVADGAWRWNDGDRFTYTKWRSGHPDTSGNCMSVGVLGWQSEPCTQSNNYICEQVKLNNVSVTTEDIHLNEADGSAQVYCSASGLPIPSVNWIRATGDDVPTSPESSVYQSSGSGFSTLTLTNANVFDSGDYICNAWNQPVGGKVEMNKTLTVSVSGTPRIASIEPYACNASLFVQWEPNRRAVGFPHRIVITSQDGGEAKVLFLTPSPSSQLTEISDLNSSTSYNITIVACSSESCSSNFTTSTSVNTGGIPNQVESPTLVQNKVGDECVVNWTRPEVTPLFVIGEYVITLIPTLVKVRGNHTTSQIETANVTNDIKDHLFKPYPNRNYTIEIQARSCAGLSYAARAVGYCVTNVGAPTKISVPAISEMAEDNYQTRTVTFTIPDESNGLISCLFVIVAIGDAASMNEMHFTMDELNEANSGSSSGPYIAIAKEFSSLVGEESQQKFEVGDGQHSFCNLYHTTSRRRKRQASTNMSVYEGTNKELQKNATYRIFLASSTPTEDSGVLFQRSPSVFFTTIPKDTGSMMTTVLAVGLTLFSTMLVVLVVIFVIRRWNASKKATQEEELTASNAATGTVVYENVSFKNSPISARGIMKKEFHKIYNEMRKNGNKMFMDEFKDLEKKAAVGMTSKVSAFDPRLKKKNRGENILPFDDSRVAIRGNDTDHVNACYIDGFERRRKFIASQGPLPGTVNDFWAMVFEERCGVIVMLTKEIEAGKEKCERYWPEKGMTREFGPVTVKHTEEIYYGSFIRRTFQAKLTEEIYDNPLIIHHFQFLKWPDHSVPPTTSGLVRMHRAVVESQAIIQEGPSIVVHCSARAGRTGTFVGYDILVEELRKNDRVDVYGCVTNMRKQRVDMVQNCEQYTLLYKLVLEFCMHGDTDLEARDVEAKLEESASSGQNGTILAMEFANLSNISPIKDTKTNGQSNLNDESNKIQETIPYGYNEVNLIPEPGEHGSPYINASWVEAYDDSTSMIAAQSPMNSTVECFWRAVWDNNVSTIVLLGRQEKNENELCAQYWPPDAGVDAKYTNISVTLSEARAEGSIMKRKLNISRQSQTKTVTLLQYSDWGVDACPKDGSGVINLISKMQENMRDGNRVILIHCSDGAGRTGAFCAIVNLIERLGKENKVDVFRAVKDLRDGRPGMVQSLDQYTFCHKVIVDYVKSFQHYSNF